MRCTEEQLERKWQQYFTISMQYYIEFSNLDVPYDKVYNKVFLGHWISRQRVLYHQGKLPEEKINALHSIGMIWAKHRKTRQKKSMLKPSKKDKMVEKERQEWMKYYYQFKESCFQNAELKKWLESQLVLMNQGKLSPERERLLVRKGIYKTETYYQFVRKMARKMFRNIVLYYKDHHTFPLDEDIPMCLDKTLDEWCIYFDCNMNGILSDKEYYVWKKIVKKRVVSNVKLKEKVLKK